MSRLLRAAASATAVVLVASSCRDALSPSPSGHLTPPVEPRLTVTGPPDENFVIGQAGNSKVALTTYAYATYVMLEVSNSIFLSQSPRLQVQVHTTNGLGES